MAGPGPAASARARRDRGWRRRPGPYGPAAARSRNFGDGARPASSERLDRHQHDDGGEEQDGGLVVDAEPAVAALVGQFLEAAQQAAVHVVITDDADDQ